jgi:hypothetical protein
MSVLFLSQIFLLLVTGFTVVSLGLVVWQLLKRGIAALRRRRP